ncbi:MAG: hypothetical protein ACTS22_04435 [Phycisphaerales bacterium]
MAFTPQPGERYTIRQKIFKIFGEAFHIYDDQGTVIGYCKQKAFRLRERLVLYTDESQRDELLTIQARTILDFGTTYDVSDHARLIGSIRRRGVRSMLRDEWTVLGVDGEEIATLREDSMGRALARRFIPLVATLSPQRFELTTADGAVLAVYRTHFNLFVYRLGIAIGREGVVDEMLLLAVGFLIAAIEGRQGSDDSGAGFLTGN